MTKKVRVLLVDDSVTVRARLRSVLSDDPACEVVAEAGDGAQAIDLCQRLRPSVITMDIVLPGVSGLVAIARIMAHNPTPILVVSSASNRSELFDTFDALAAGAVDVLDKPRGDRMNAEWAHQLIAAVKMVARIPVMTHPGVPPEQARARNRAAATADVALRSGRYDVIAIGASTGGPAALTAVLSTLPVRHGAAILLVQHLSDPFGAGFADWLSREIGRAVSFPRDGDSLADATGRIVVAPPGQHMEVRDGRLRLNREPERHSCRPSVDVLFESLARERGPTTAACVLTGMGRDGAQGLLSIRDSGGLTMGQDQASAAVYGMPRAAAMIGAAQLVLPLHQIGPTLAVLAALAVVTRS